MNKLVSVLLTSAIALTGCATYQDTRIVSSTCTASAPVKVSGVGYGASSSFDGYTPGQKRLMAMRASKLDAYRSLAEQIYGVRVSGNSTVAAMMAQNDSFRVYVDAYLKGARVLSVTPMADGNYETILEIELDDRFFNSACQRAPSSLSVPTVNVAAPIRPVEVQSCGIKGAVGPGCAYGGTFYYSE